ncbi:MAG TPA: MG2 domain-containing protein [Mucilaginibacter sp.]
MPKITLAIPTVITVALTLFFLLPTSVFSQAAHQLLNDKITGALLRNAARPVEKAYLQFDKPYYAAGDTIYFKAYVTLRERHRLSDQSGVLHVDLINPYNKIDQSIKLQLVNGLASGDFSLPDSLPRGRYRVRAYTRLMSGEDEPAFFECELPVNNINTQHISANPSIKNGTAAKTDIQFFPEGGTLVSGIISKVAFKAIGTDGKGVAVSGGIFDSGNNKVCSFSSAHLGMGSFNLLPQEGQSYTARIKYPDGSKGEAKLPATATSGLALTVNNDALPQVNIKIEANQACFAQNKGKDYTMVVYSGGTGTIITCRLDTNIIVLDVAKRHLLTGVATITLFSPEGEPLSERLFFVQNYNVLKVDLKTDQTVYSPRGEVKINLNVKNRADSASAGHFSVSVVDESKVAIDENDEHTILTELLLTSDLKGKVEQPNYYFTNINDETNRNLDLVMLTHGYRRFAWKQLLNDSTARTTVQPEKGIEIAGVAETMGGRPLSKAVVSLIAPFSGWPLTTGTADDKGRFRFVDLVFRDTAKFILQAVNAKGGNNTQLVYAPDGPVPVTPLRYNETAPTDTADAMKAYIKNSIKQNEQLFAQGKATGKMLKEVKIKDRKTRPVVMTDYGIVDYTLKGSDIIPGSSLVNRLDYMIPGVRFERSNPGDNAFVYKRVTVSYPPVPMRVVVDGIQMEPEFNINSLSAATIDKIEVITNPTSSDMHTEGAMLITLKYGHTADEISSKGILPIHVPGFYKAREFYSPKYEAAETSKLSDLRTTIYWNPEIVTNGDGNASLNYFNADAKGTYRVTIEGIDNKGNLGRLVYRYQVQ